MPLGGATPLIYLIIYEGGHGIQPHTGFSRIKKDKGVRTHGMSHPASLKETVSISGLTRQIRQASIMDGYSNGFINSFFLGMAGHYSWRDDKEARKLWSQYGSLKGYRG